MTSSPTLLHRARQAIPALACALLVACSSEPPFDPYGPPPVQTVVEVMEEEFVIWPRAVAKAPAVFDGGALVLPQGRVRFAVRNEGDISHDFVLLRGLLDSNAIARTRILTPGAHDREVVDVTLAAGDYWLVCTVSNHYERGMALRLRVRPA